MTSNAAQSSPKDESLFDFLYLDRVRLASYLAQMFDDGIHLSSKKTAASGNQFSNTASGNALGLLKAGLGTTETTNETIERQFDASWSAPLSLLRELNDLGYVKTFSKLSALGQMIFFKGNIQILDLRILQKLWQPMLAMESELKPAHTEAQRKAKKAEHAQAQAIARVAENLPHIIQLRAFNDDHQLWATLTPEALTVNPSDLAFKHGPSIPGDWAILGLLDARPSGEDEMKLPAGLGQVESGMLQMALQLKHFLGRNFADYGITPIAIYREVAR